MTMTPDVNVVVLDFKNTKDHEMVTENPDGSYTIFINSRLSYEGQLHAYEHGMRHITNDDFRKDDVQKIEAVAHEQTQTIVKEELSDFHKRILAEIRRSKKQIQKELRKIKERNEWLEENDPGYWDRMESYNLERQRLGDY